MGVLVPDKIPGLAQKMAASARFRDVLLSGYVCKLDELLNGILGAMRA